jgi:hypothetical protein
MEQTITTGLVGLFVSSETTDAIKTLAELDGELLVAAEAKEIAWQRLRGNTYDPRMVDRFTAKADLCSMLTHRIIRHKSEHGI